MRKSVNTFLLIAISGAMIFGCGKNNLPKTSKRNKTPSNMVMTHREKNDVNYDARENRKAIEENLKNKEANQKAAEKQRKKQVEQMTEANNNTSKATNKYKKKRTHEAFGFY